MAIIKNIFDKISEYLNVILFRLGQTNVTIWTLIYFLILIFLLFYITAKIKKWMVYKLLAKSEIDIGVRLAVGTIIRYIVLLIGFIIIIESAGIDLSAITILAGALGVGIGFGLQNITNNFVSGLIILFERPIKVGDRIEVGDISGGVVKISMRATTVLTNDNIAIIVPNSEFISSKVINWSHNDRKVRFNYPVGVSYKEDPEKVKNILMEIANKNKDVLSEPPPEVLLDEYGDSSINFILRVWTIKYIDRPNVLKSQLYFEVFKKFKENKIEIPYPQRDIHLKSPDINITPS